jgi:hypothetical protein
VKLSFLERLSAPRMSKVEAITLFLVLVLLAIRVVSGT